MRACVYVCVWMWIGGCLSGVGWLFLLLSFLVAGGIYMCVCVCSEKMIQLMYKHGNNILKYTESFVGYVDNSKDVFVQLSTYHE